MTEVLFQRLAIVGMGLIGSSVARAIRRDGTIAQTVVAHDANPAVLDRVRSLDIADVVLDDLAEAVMGADGVMLCVPVGAYSAIAAVIGRHLASGAIVTETGSTKQSVVRDLASLPPRVHLVPTHPMAGTEYSGPDAGFGSLFDDRWCLVAPTAGTDPAAIELVCTMWRRFGSFIEIMDPAHHDRLVAIVSHLPHLIAFTICGTADDLADESRQQVMKFAAAGFRDFTRIAASDPVMWRDIFLNNREALLEMLARFTEDTQAMARAVRWGDGAYIEEAIARGRAIRRGLIEARQA